MKRIDLYAKPAPAALERAAAVRLNPRDKIIDLLHNLLERAEGMAGLLANAANAEAFRPCGGLMPAHVAAVAASIQDEIRMALKLLDDSGSEPPGGDG